MKLIIVLSVIACIHVNAKTFGQKVNLNVNNASLGKVFDIIEKQTGYHFFYEKGILKDAPLITLHIENANLTDALNLCLKNRPFTYFVLQNNIGIKRKAIPKTDSVYTAAAPQPVIIKGKVTDVSNAPIAGVTVLVKGTKTGTFTDSKGTFSLSLGKENRGVLIFSYVGYQTKEVEVGEGQSDIAVQLTPLNSSLDSVVVVGYGKQTKQSVVGAISQIDSKQLEQTGAVNLGQALTGKLPGLTTLSGLAEPGNEDPQIYIRGQSTWNNSSPLILVDGIERSMSGLDINSIATISVLKDASATAVFGVRGANGVILITTKRGVVGKAQINVAVTTTLKAPSRLPPKYDSYDALRIRDLAIERELPLNPASWADYTPYAELNKYRNPANEAEAERYPNVDWTDATVRKTSSDREATLSVSGGTNFVKYYTSADYLHEGDIMKEVPNGKGYSPGYGYDRLNVRSNLDFKITKSTTFTANIAGLYGNKQDTWIGFAYIPFQAIYALPPDVMPVQYSNGYYGYYPNNTVAVVNTPAALSNNGVHNLRTTQIQTDFTFDQKLDMVTKGLDLKATYSLDNTFVSEGGKWDGGGTLSMWINPVTGDTTYQNIRGTNQFDYTVPLWSTRPDAMQNGSTKRNKFYQVQLYYGGAFGKHNVTAMGLFSRQETATGSEFPHYREDWVFRGTYNYANKYFAEFNGAYDGSEQFSNAHRFQFFPSMALGWMLTNEKFMKNISWINSLKIRGSVGLVGDDNVNGRWLYQNSWAYGGNAQLGASGNTTSPYTQYMETSIGNPDVHWETERKINLGLDYTLLNGLLEGTFDAFNNYRYDILIAGSSRAVPDYFGGTPPVSNLGKVRVKGYEFELKFNKNINKNIRLWADFNMSHSKDRILDADDPQLLDAYQKQAGFQIGQYRSQVIQGYYNTWDQVYGSSPVNAYDNQKLPGNFNLLDYNGDGVINSYDVVPYGYPDRPQNTYNLTLGVDYKHFSMYVQFYATNNVTRDVTQTSFPSALDAVYNQGSYWTKDDITARSEMPRWKTNVYSWGNFYDYDGSYVRLKTAEVSYSINSGFVKKWGMQQLRIFLNGNDLFFWSKLPDDREANLGPTYSGQGAYPSVKRYNLGIKLDL